MTDIRAGVEKAVFDRLTAQIVGAGVYQHSPQDAAPPFVMLSDVTSESGGGKSGGLDRLIVTIQCEEKKPGRKALNALMAQARTALDQWKPAATLGVLCGTFAFQGDDSFRIDEDDHYFGTLRFLTFAQPSA